MWETENVKIYEKKKWMRLSIVVRNRVKLVVEGKAERKETDNNIACFNNNLKTKLNWVIRNTTRRSKCRWTRAVLSSSLKRADCRSWGWILSHVTFRQSFAQLSSPLSEGGAKGELESEQLDLKLQLLQENGAKSCDEQSFSKLVSSSFI